MARIKNSKTESDDSGRKLIVIGGGKGGVGKSIGTQAVVDTILYRGETPADPDSVLVVETDTSNPDVSKVYAKIAKERDVVTRNRVSGAPIVKDIALDDETGFIQVGNLIEGLDASTRYVVINSAARATDRFVSYESMLRDVAEQCDMECNMLWFINRQRDSLELLKNWLDAVESTSWKTSVVKNTYFGSADKFQRFDNGNLKNRAQQMVVFPELNDHVADKLVDGRLGLWNADTKLTLAERSALARFRAAAHVAFQEVV